ncbi:MAG: hypothetical protein U1G07_00215 [Verrucomicrobiota bacterium]
MKTHERLVTNRTHELKSPAGTKASGAVLGFLLLSVCYALTAGCAHRQCATYPIGIYGVQSTNEQTIVREAGFNIVVGRAETAYLDCARGLGLKVLAPPGTSAGPRFQPGRARRVIQEFDRHPALWSWYLIDEPDLHAIAPEDVTRADRFVKSLGARKPTTLALYQGAEAFNYASAADIVMVDRYPVPWLPLANFPQHIRLARFAAGKDKPLIAVIQAFDWNHYPQLRPPAASFRPPTYEEIRCMTYAALARRASGLFYYCYDDESWKMRDHADTWNALKRVIAEVNQLLPLFEAAHVWYPFVHEIEPAQHRFNEALETSIIPALLQIAEGNAFLAPGKYLLAVNTTDRQLNYRVALEELKVKSLPVLGETDEIILRGHWLEDRFEPYAVRVYGPLAWGK